MFKKFITIATATLMFATGLAVVAAPTASAATITDATATSTGTIGTSGTNATAITISATLRTPGDANTFKLDLPTGWSFATTPNITTNRSGALFLAIGTGLVLLNGAFPFASRTEVSITFAANALNVGSNRIFRVRFVDDRTGSPIDIDSGDATLAVGGSTPAPSTPAEIAAAAAATAAAAVEAARAAEAAAAAIRAAEIATAQTALSTVLKSDKPGTLSEFRAANINVTTTAALTRLNAEILKLAGADRTDFAKIKALADKIEFDESFFNATARPSIATYSTYGVNGVTERILPTINSKVLELPAALRADVKAMQELVKVESFVDRVANTVTRGSVSAQTLIQRGLFPAESPYKFSVVQGLASYPEGSLNSMAKIEAAVKEQIFKAEAPKRRLAEIKAKIAARRK